MFSMLHVTMFEGIGIWGLKSRFTGSFFLRGYESKQRPAVCSA